MAPKLDRVTGSQSRIKSFLRPLQQWPRGLLLAFGLLISVNAPAQSPDPSPSGLIGWWPGDTNANDLASTNNGTLEAGATAGNPGYVGGSFLFDGTNDFVSIPGATALRPTNMTIECWLRCDLLDTPTTTSYPGQQYVVFRQNAQSSNFEGFDLAKDREPRGTLTTTNDTWCFEMTSVEGVNTYVESVTTVQTNVWYHIAGVRGSNYIQIYVNGILETQSNIDFPIGYGTEPLYFGTTGQSYWDHKFAGALDEVSLYSRALSSNEIYAIYAAGHQGKYKIPTVMSIALTNGATHPALNIAGVPGQAYGIQASSTAFGPTNRWVGLTNLTLSKSTAVWLDPTPATNYQRFYRVLSGTISVP